VNADWYQYQIAGEEALQEGDYACAETMWLAAYEQAKKFKKFDARFAVTLEGLGEALWHQGKYAEATALCEQVLEIFKITRGIEHPDVGVTANNLAMLYKAQGKYEQAELLYQRAIEIMTRSLGPDHHDVSYLLSNYKDLLRIMGRSSTVESRASAPVTAEQLTKSGQFQTISIKPQEKLINDTMSQDRLMPAQVGEQTWAQYRQSAEQALMVGDFSKAEEMWHGAMRRADNFKESDPRLTITLESLAEVLWKQGKYSDAEVLCRRTMQIYEDTLGFHHPDVGIISNNLAMLYHAQRKYAQAEPLYKRALPIRTQALGADHPAVNNLISNYQNLLRATGRSAEAERVKFEAQSITSGRWTRSGSYQALTIPQSEKLHDLT
jgi:tetratricopeptide (TPR) repeat protein